jgi:K+-transporting ATPase ATPase C chain
MEKRIQDSGFGIQGKVAFVRAPLILLLLFTLLLGVIYPLLVTGIAKVVFPQQSAGSLILRDGKAIGSELLGQPFSAPGYFWGRPSATTPPYNAASSGASNMNPGNPKLLEAVNDRLVALKKADPRNTLPVPVDLLTASASGLDPHISVAAARYQAARVARARKWKQEEVDALIEAHAQGYMFGDAYVNVLALNLAMDGKQGDR